MITTDEQRLLAPTMLYRFALPLQHTELAWKKSGIELDENHVIPSLASLDGMHPYADIRGAWNKEGMYFNVNVTTKQQSLWCRDTQLIDSDGVQFWVDTRNTNNVHRATRYCHWFVFLPTGGGSKRDQPVASMLKINRSKEDPKSMNQVPLKVWAKPRNGGYQLAAFIPKNALTGWDETEHTKIGFNYLVLDRELGSQPLAVNPEFPISENPSLWQTIELTS